MYSINSNKLNTLSGLAALGFISVESAARQEKDEERPRFYAKRGHWVLDGNWRFHLTTGYKPDGVHYYVSVSDGRGKHVSSTSILEYSVEQNEKNGDWWLLFQTRTGTVHSVNIGKNAMFDAAFKQPVKVTPRKRTT